MGYNTWTCLACNGSGFTTNLSTPSACMTQRLISARSVMQTGKAEGYTYCETCKQRVACERLLSCAWFRLAHDEHGNIIPAPDPKGSYG